MLRYLLVFALLTLGACDASVMTSSGRAYIAERNISDPDLVAVAAVEPDLRFPARIGVVRTVYDQVTNVPDAERDLLLDGMPEGLGQFVQISALDARLHRFGGWDSAKQLRTIAASRHLDYLLVLAFDPGRNTSEAVLLDVASGYPYLSASYVGTGRGKRTFWGGRLRHTDRVNRATMKLATGLQPKLYAAARTLLATARR